jgi:hypothetical protein
MIHGFLNNPIQTVDVMLRMASNVLSNTNEVTQDRMRSIVMAEEVLGCFNYPKQNNGKTPVTLTGYISYTVHMSGTVQTLLTIADLLSTVE